jgi:hypothetical protein
MTFLVALRRLGVSSIVADSLLTEGTGHDRDHSFASIKNGVLCPGIIYGLCGDAEGALRFVTEARAAVTGVNPQNTWEEFERFASGYQFPKPPHGRFGVLLSSRHAGCPQFYSIDSYEERITEWDQDVGFMGSEGADLDGISCAFLGASLNEKRSAELLIEHPSLKPRDIPHFFVFFMFQQSFGDRSYELQQIGVGGYSSYVWQDRDAEGRQTPGLYLIAQGYPEKQVLVIHRHRIAFDRHPTLGELMVVTEKPQGMPAAWYVLMQNMSNSTIEVNEEALLDDVIGRHSVEPPYELLIAGSGSVIGKPYCVWPDVRVPGLQPLADLSDYIAPQLLRLLEFMHEEQFEAWVQNTPRDQNGFIRLDPWTQPKE